jgi:hypothetical protein
MRVLVIGGTRFIGPRLVCRLVAAARQVAVFHKGQTTAVLPAAARILVGDRHRLADPEPLAAQAGEPLAPPPLRLLRGRGPLALLQVALVRLGPLGHSSAKAFEHGWQSLRSFRFFAPESP